MTKDPHEYALKNYKNDKYEDRDYNGLYIFTLGGKNYVAKMRWVREGGMREFYDPISGDYIGCCECNTANKIILNIFEFANKYLFNDRPINDENK